MPLALEGPEEIHEHGGNRDNKHDAGHYGDGLGPVNYRAENIVVYPHKRVEERQRPEAQEAEPVAIERVLGRHREEVVYYPEPRRGYPEPHGIVYKKAVERHVVDPGHGIREYKVPKQQVNARPYEPRCYVP